LRPHVQWNFGMTAAVMLLVTGALMVVLGAEGTTLHTVGFGIVVLALAVYLGVRVRMLVGRRPPPER